MKRFFIGFLSALALISVVAYAGINTDYIVLGFGGVDRAKVWVSPDGRLGAQSLISGNPWGIDLWPNAYTQPTQHSYNEITFQRRLWTFNGFERFNISAMVDSTDGGAYRFGVERGGEGQYRDMIFCFEDYSPGQANCVMKITTGGVYLSDNGGSSWRKL